MRVCLACAVACALLLAPGAFGVEATINPGVGIGKVKLGMSATEVGWALGLGSIVNDRKTINGMHYMELSWNLSEWSIDFVERGGIFRAVQIGTTLRAQKTPSGVGPGTPWLSLVRAYRFGLCSAYGNALGLPSPGLTMGLFLEYLVPHKGGTQTIFVLRGIYDRMKRPALRNYVVMQVQVRRPEWPLAEFAPDSPSRCAPGWESSRTPQPIGRR